MGLFSFLFLWPFIMSLRNNSIHSPMYVYGSSYLFVIAWHFYMWVICCFEKNHFLHWSFLSYANSYLFHISTQQYKIKIIFNKTDWSKYLYHVIKTVTFSQVNDSFKMLNVTIVILRFHRVKRSDRSHFLCIY